MNTWISLITSLPTENATARMRAWRALKASGAAVLRDGVYLLPDRPACRQLLQDIAADLLAAGGTALLVGLVPPPDLVLETLFDRQADYATLLEELTRTRSQLADLPPVDAARHLRRLQRQLAGIADTDFFPGEALGQARAALQGLEDALARLRAPGEPQPAAADDQPIARLPLAGYQGRLWATRRRLWVDRLACAWLIRRCIDPQARFLWLADPADCPPDALGFDFDGARFTHVGSRVSFEVLLASFGLDSPALARLGTLVHALDVGGVPPPEAAGVESVLAGLRATLPDDDALLAAACTVWDGLLQHYQPAAPGDAHTAGAQP